MSNKRSQRNTKSFKKARARAGISRQDLRSGGRVTLQNGGMGFGTTLGQDDEATTTPSSGVSILSSPNKLPPPPPLPPVAEILPPQTRVTESDLVQEEARKADEADKTRQADEAAAKARKDVEDKKIIQAEQDIKFKEVLKSDEAKNLEQTAKDVLKDNSAFKDLKVKTKGILNSGMSPEKQQEALNNLAGETQKVMAYALQQPAMQQAVKSLQRRSTFSNGGMGSAQDDPDTAIPTGEDSAAPNAQDRGFFGRVLSSIWGGVVGFIDSPIGTTLSLASGVIGIPGAVMDMMTGMFKTDTGQENVLFRDALNSADFQDQISDDGRVLDDDPTVINTGFDTTDGTGDSRINTTVTVDPVTGEPTNNETSSDTVHNKPGSGQQEGDKVEDENRQNPTQPPNNAIRGPLQKSAEQAYNDDGSLALKREVDTLVQKEPITHKERATAFEAYKKSADYDPSKYGSSFAEQLEEYEDWLKGQPTHNIKVPEGTEIADDKIQRLASESTPEENVASFKAYQKSEGYDPSKYGDGSGTSLSVMAQSADGQWWTSPQAAAEYEAWLQDQPRPPKATAGTVASPSDITSTTGEAVTADLPGRTLKPEEQKKRFQDSDAFKNFDKNTGFSPAVIAFSSDGQMWPNPGQRDAYEEWLKTAPATESDLKAVTYDAATADDLTDLIAASGTVSKEPTASDADLTDTTAAQRDAEQETAAKATAAERPGRKLSPEENKKRFRDSNAFRNFDKNAGYSPALMSKSSDGQWWPNPAQRDAYNAWLTEQPEITSEYAEGVTSPEEYIINNPDDPQVRERVLSVITEEEITALRKISQGRVIPVEEVMKRFPAIKKRVVQQGAFASRGARQLGEAPTETAAEADYKEMQDVAAGIKEDIGDIGQAGQASRDGVTSEGIGDMAYAGVGPEEAALKERTAITEELKREAEEQQTEALDPFTLDRERKAQTGTAASRTESQVTAIPDTPAARARYYGVDYTPEGGDTDIDKTPAFQKAATRVAQVQKAAESIAKQLGDSPSLDLEGREAILGEPPVGDAAQIGGIPTFAAAQMEAVKGQDRMVGAADMNAVVADLPEEITAAIAEDPATVEAQLDTDPDPKVVAAVAALPEEALVSTQMSNLLAGMEEGKTPLWARPAVSAVEQMMASRGLSASSVGRDALFNAIIQSALPMAQSNAQALQQRAQQNLSNEQQANLASAQNTMQVRMQNLSNRQTAASQTASMSQQIKVQQGQFNQQAKILSGEQLQQTEMANFQAAQQRASQESSQRQQAAIATFSSNAQMDLANLKAESLRSAKDMDAESAGRLAKYNADINKIMRQADFTQDMEKANISAELQIEAIDLNNLNLAAKDTMTAEQQERLTNFQTFVDFKKTNVQLAQQMELANLSNDQQMRYAELQDKVATDSANVTADNQFELAELTAKIQRSARQAELDQRMEEANLNVELKVELSELSEKNTTSRANMTSEQQMRLRRIETLVDFKKTNAQLAQQMDMANMSNEQQIEMAELADKAATDSANFSEANRFRLTQLQTSAQHMAQNTEFRQQTELANFSGAERIQLANLQALNQASSENLTVAQQTELANLNSKLTVGIKNAELEQQAISQTFSADQQIELANLEALNRADADSMSADQQSKLASYTAKVQRTIRQTELNQDMEKANLDVRLKSELAVLSEKNATERANMSSDQQMRLANLSTLVDFKKTDVAMAQQMDMANMGNEQQMELANLAERASTDAANMTAENNRRLSDLQTYASVMSENAQLAQQSDLANLSMEEKIRLVNLTEANRADSESMSAENVAELQMFEKKMAAGQVNAQLAQQMGLANLSNQQAAAMFNAQVNADLDMTQFNFEQQTELANSKFLQTMTATDLNNRQQAVMQDATTLAAMDMQSADNLTKVSIENARNFLQMDMANLSNEQQAAVLDQQLSQQRILSNQSAENASRQFNANSENQVNQFMANLGADMAKFNAIQTNTMEQFNVSEKNRIAALDTNNQIEVNKINATISSDISRFNASLEDSREKWNAANAQAVEQSNVEWRRHANTIDTAAQNAANATNIANAFGLSSRDSAFLWQELRDNMTKDFQRELTQQQRQVAIVNSALQSESFLTDSKYETARDKLFEFMERLLGFDLSSTGSAATGEGSDLEEDDAGNVGNTVEVNN